MNRVYLKNQPLMILVFLLLSLPVCAETIHSKSSKDILDLFNRIGYTQEAWKKGIREIPKVFITNIPKRWQKDSQSMPVKDKKALFFRLAAPAVLHANNLIKEERRKLIALKDSVAGNSLTASQKEWLQNLAKRYKVTAKGGANNEINTAMFNELLVRVDEIPVSLALAQAVEESGWGTSRFAIKGNAIFGQWDFSGKGIKPKNQRKELGNYGIARFDSPQDSVNSYMNNLNTHNAYSSLRKLRTRLREGGAKVTGYKLAEKLDKYSERGQAYVKGLHDIMRINGLKATDEAYLWDKEIIYISPVE